MFKQVICIFLFTSLGVAGSISSAANDFMGLGAKAGTIRLTIHPEYASPTVDFEGYCYDSIGGDERFFTCLTYKWDFGDGSAVSNLQNPTHTYTSTGIYKISLTTKDNINEPVEQTEVLVAFQDSYRQVLMQTNREPDLSIQGEGFFQIRLPNGNTAYTRIGSFLIDNDGNIVTRKGYYLEPLIRVPLDSQALIVNESGEVSVKLPNMKQPQEIGQIILVRFSKTAGLGYMGDQLLFEMAESGPPMEGQPGSPGYGAILQSYREVGFISH